MKFGQFIFTILLQFIELWVPVLLYQLFSVRLHQIFNGADEAHLVVSFLATFVEFCCLACSFSYFVQATALSFLHLTREYFGVSSWFTQQPLGSQVVVKQA